MEDLQKSIFVNELFDIYGDLLSPTQHKMIQIYYGLDLSLSEIASQENISRNAIHDAIKKGVDSLIHFEEKLHILEHKKSIENKLEQVKNSFDEETYQKIYDIFKEVL